MRPVTRASNTDDLEVNEYNSDEDGAENGGNSYNGGNQNPALAGF